jgi:hypothetical protein
MAASVAKWRATVSRIGLLHADNPALRHAVLLPLTVEHPLGSTLVIRALGND